MINWKHWTVVPSASFGAIRSLLLWGIGLGCWGLGAGQGADFLSMNPTTRRMSADIRNETIRRTLETLAIESAWDIYLEPGITQTINTRFSDLALGDALDRLLHPLNYVLIPNQNRSTTLLVYQSSAKGATERIEGSESVGQKANPDFKNELIVTLKKDGQLSPEQLAEKYGAKVVGSLKEVDAHRLAFEDAQSAAQALSSIQSEEGVRSVETNQGLARPGSPEFLSSGTASHPLLKPQSPKEGANLVIGLIDTAIPEPNPFIAPFLLDQKSIYPGTTFKETGVSHGMAMAETMLKGMEMVGMEGATTRILPVDIYGQNEITSTFDVAMGINLAVKEGATVINLSLGSAEQSPFVEDLITLYKDQGLLFVAAAGNEPVTTPTYPAAYSPVLAVTAGNRQGELAPYANRGDFIDVIAPGASIVHDQNAQSFLGTGTSFSSAYVAGVAAGLVEQGRITLQEAEKRILNTLGFQVKP